jgi:hypothetical protein
MFPTFRALGFIFLAAVAVNSAPAQSEPAEPAVNLDLFRQMALSIGRTVTGNVPPLDSGYTLVSPFGSGAANAVNRGLRGAFVSGDTAALGKCARECEFAVLRMEIRYSDPHRSGVFGERLVVRTASLSLAVRVTDLFPKKLLLEKEYQSELRDTVAVAMIRTLENPALPETHGTLPDAGFFANFAEPLVMIGAIGVAVFLLFQIRS